MNDETTGQPPLISVIVPVYHSEDTLEACAESILRGQDYENIELLLVANGLSGEDGALQLCRRLQKKDERIRLIELEKAGVSGARNEGIRRAKGELIRFVDSDDMLPEGSLRRLYERMREDESDLVIGGYEHLYYGRSVEKLPSYSGCFSFRDAPQALCGLYLSDYLNPPWNKLYKKSLIGSDFPEDMSLGEDLCFNLSCLLSAGKVSVLAEPVYRYIQGESEGSLSGRTRSDRTFVCMQLYRRMLRFFDAMGIDREQAAWAAETKVVSTFLDEIGILGCERLSGRQKRRRIRHYVKATHRFVKGKKRQIRLTWPDHKILYPFAARGMWRSVCVLSALRALVVKVRRKKP